MRVFLETVGCRLNQSEIETMARQFQQGGHEIVRHVEQADLVVVNTCAVTSDAARSSRTIIRRAGRDNPDARIVATGCYAELAPQQLKAISGVERVVSNSDKSKLVAIVTGQNNLPDFYLEPINRHLVHSALNRTRAFVKVQDGCDNHCTFCVTTLARGAGKSRSLESIIAEVQMLAQIGYQEVVLTGVHLGSYGHDLGWLDGLRELVVQVLDGTDIPRLRLSSLEPWDLTPDFFELWSDPRMCRHLHLPLQSGCDATLKRMARRTSQVAFAGLVDRARSQIPHLAISTDVIVGFPGETDVEYAESRDFVEQMDFMKLHVFRYSRRPGTGAARMREQIPEAIKKQRSADLLALSDRQMSRFLEQFVGCEVDVLWEQVAGSTPGGFVNSGLTDNYVRVEMIHPEPLTNQITRVHVVAASDGCLVAELLRDSAAQSS